VNEWAIVFIGGCVLAWALVERRLSSTAITGPMVFVALGLLAGSDGLGIIEADSGGATSTINIVLEGTLALVLFTDAAALHPSSWRKDASLPGRLLGIGLPLTIAAGWLIALLLFDDLGVWEAAIVGAIIAPTDAALGKAVISNPRVPERVRTGLDVESGLNDGVSLPFILIFMALAQEDLGDNAILTTFVREIGVAVLVGVGVGVLAGWLLIQASRANWIGSSAARISIVAIAIIAFATADQLDGSGFIACFVAGLTFGGTTRGRISGSDVFASDLGSMLTQVSFLLVGAVVLGPALGDATWQIWLMAILALTVARIGPVALSLLGTGMRPPTVAYIGWFGPRGLATIVFAALVVTDADLPGNDLIVTTAAITVGLSVYAHGLTAAAGAERYADWYDSHDDPTNLAAGKPLEQHPARQRLRPSRPTQLAPPKAEGPQDT
jgi:NhaP-type Na+/H+ or K+/H+ antiporter